MWFLPFRISNCWKNLQSCPGYTDWSVWSTCSALCRESNLTDVPTRTRTKCWNDGEQDLCINCDQSDNPCEVQESENCNEDICIGKCNSWKIYNTYLYKVRTKNNYFINQFNSKFKMAVSLMNGLTGKIVFPIANKERGWDVEK